MTTYVDVFDVMPSAHARPLSDWAVIRTEVTRPRVGGDVCPSPALCTAEPRIGSPMKSGRPSAFRAFVGTAAIGVDATNQPVQGSIRPAPPG
jgi:hypothetical protein